MPVCTRLAFCTISLKKGPARERIRQRLLAKREEVLTVLESSNMKMQRSGLNMGLPVGISSTGYLDHGALESRFNFLGTVPESNRPHTVASTAASSDVG